MRLRPEVRRSWVYSTPKDPLESLGVFKVPRAAWGKRARRNEEQDGEGRGREGYEKGMASDGNGMGKMAREMRIEWVG